jgi:hypothetical protein
MAEKFCLRQRILPTAEPIQVATARSRSRRKCDRFFIGAHPSSSSPQAFDLKRNIATAGSPLCPVSPKYPFHRTNLCCNWKANSRPF